LTDNYNHCFFILFLVSGADTTKYVGNKPRDPSPDSGRKSGSISGFASKSLGSKVQTSSVSAVSKPSTTTGSSVGKRTSSSANPAKGFFHAVINESTPATVSAGAIASDPAKLTVDTGKVDDEKSYNTRVFSSRSREPYSPLVVPGVIYSQAAKGPLGFVEAKKPDLVQEDQSASADDNTATRKRAHSATGPTTPAAAPVPAPVSPPVSQPLGKLTRL
jgi:hypothetical protein